MDVAYVCSVEYRDAYRRGIGIKDPRFRWDVVGPAFAGGKDGALFSACRAGDCSSAVAKRTFYEYSKTRAVAEPALQAHVYDRAPDVTVPVLDAWECDDTQSVVYIIPRLQTVLLDRLRQLAQDMPQLFVLARHIVELVQKLRATGVAHRDLHSEQLMSPDPAGVGPYYILDFGRASLGRGADTAIFDIFDTTALGDDNSTESPLVYGVAVIANTFFKSGADVSAFYDYAETFDLPAWIATFVPALDDDGEVPADHTIMAPYFAQRPTLVHDSVVAARQLPPIRATAFRFVPPPPRPPPPLVVAPHN